MVAKHPKSKFNRSGYAFAAGMGFGLMFGIISYITQLVQALGPGVLMCPSCPSISLYFISGKLAHKSWSAVVVAVSMQATAKVRLQD